MEKTSDFFKTLYRRCTEGEVEFRFVPPGKNPQNPVTKKFISLSKFRLPRYPDGRNIYFGVATRDGKGGGKENLVEIPALWTDLDFKNTSEKAVEERLKDFPLKPSVVVETDGGYHLYWFLRKPSTKEEVPLIETYLDRIASFLGGDQGATDASRILRVPETLNLKSEYKPPRRVIIKKLDPSLEYNLVDFDFLPEAESRAGAVPTAHLHPGWQDELLNGIPEGERNTNGSRLAGRWFGMGHSEAEVLIFLQAWNQRNTAPLPDRELEEIVKSIGRAHGRIRRDSFAAGDEKTISPLLLLSDASKWPSPLEDRAYHGLAGEFIRLVEPHTESDPIALLIQFLASVGSVIGMGSYFRVEADTHYLNLFTVLVGETSKGRKGTSWGIVKNEFAKVDQEWVEKMVLSGLSSGEGLIWKVRDKIVKMEPVRQKGRVIDYQEVIDDPGVSDKRLLVIEPEFASVLKVMRREGNTLSPVIRQSWDQGDLNIVTKNSPARATGAHISIIGHITRDELTRNLDRTEAGNGFANRFIWLCVKRSKALPEGGNIRQVDLRAITERLVQAVSFGREAGEIKRDEGASEIWKKVYAGLSEGKPGLWGAVTGRAEAQVIRLASMFAILDKSNLIRPEHQSAALALWDYAEASARYIFGDSTGNPIADRILRAIKSSSSGVSLSEIHDLFQRNESRGNIQQSLALLEKFAGVQRIIQDTGGRPLEMWRVTERTK